MYCVVSVYTSPCSGEIGECRGIFADRSAAVEYVAQFHLDQKLAYDDDDDMVVLKEWLKRRLLSLNSESFFEMYGTYDPSVDTRDSFRDQIQDNQEGTRFDHWFILSVPPKALRASEESDSDDADEDQGNSHEKKRKLESSN